MTQRTPMTDADNTTYLQELLAAHRRTLAVLLRQLANLGADYAPPGVHNGIAEARAEIARLKTALRAAGVAVEDQVGDVATSDEAAKPAAGPATWRSTNFTVVVVVLAIVATSVFAIMNWPGGGSPISSPNRTATTSARPTAASGATQAVLPATLAPTTLPLPALVPELVEVPSGPFLMGSRDADSLAASDEKPQHTLNLPTYWIGKTEVTNAQFRPFVEGDGYTNQAYWTEAGWEWRQANTITRPAKWDRRSIRSSDNYPVVGVSWYEAVAYSRWLSAHTGREFRLPTEAEWEKAARGVDGWIWPWGNTWAASRVNSDEVGPLDTMPVGTYPEGASPYSALDMAGNVSEWCATSWGKPYPYQIEDEWQTVYLEASGDRVARGGGYGVQKPFVRTAFRSRHLESGTREFDDVGLRIASHASPDPGP
jgi:formylglycine-generating enzyme required for sulfatase activity